MAMVIVIGWQVYDIARASMGLKEAALRLGIIGLVQFIPLFLLTLVTGWTADRVDRRWIARGAVTLEFGCAVALALFASTGTTTFLALYTVAALLPVFARDVLDAGPGGLGRLRAAPAVGATLTAAFFSIRPLKRNVGVKMLAAVGVFGTATVIFGFSRSMPLSLGCLAILGAADMFSVYVRQSLIQLYTPDQMRGRVGAVSSLFISASNELGEAESGLLGALIGPVPAVIAGGVGAIAVVFLWAWWFPELRLGKTFDPPDLRNSLIEES